MNIRPRDTVTLRYVARYEQAAGLLMRWFPHMADREVGEVWEFWYARARGPGELVSRVVARGDLPADWKPRQESLTGAGPGRTPERYVGREVGEDDVEHDPVTGEATF